MEKEIEKISGYDLALRVLEHEYGGIEALLSLSAKDESCWLELKAGMALLPEDIKKGDTQEDLYWNIAKAVIAMMNTSGGVVLIGIQDGTHAPVPLQSNDPRHVIEKSGLDAYLRQEILNRIPPERKSWKTKDGTWEIRDHVPENHVELRKAPYKGEIIAVILVKPVQPCITTWEIKKIEQILIRDSREVGHVKPITGVRPMTEYEASERRIEDSYFASLYAKFLREAKKSSEEGILDQSVEKYYLRFNESIKKKRLFDLSCFTSLDGTGELIGDEEEDFMEPRAIELESGDWLSPDEDDSGDIDDSEDDEDPGEDDSEDEDEEDEEEVHEQRSGDLISLMQEIPRMVVLGEPGGGKTTTLIRFCKLFETVESQPGSRTLAVYIPMGQWINGGSIEQFLNKLTGLSPEQLSSLNRQNRLRLVIDAFNECPDQYKPAALLNIQSFLQRYSDLPAVISARTDEDLGSLNLPMFSVQPMDLDHQLRYLSGYLKDEAAAKDLLARLTAMSGGSALAANPMLLRMVVEIFREDHQIPPGRAGLYHKWLSQWYRREFGKAKAAGTPLPWDFEDALEILSELALQGRLQGYRDIPLEFAEKILQDYGSDCIEKLCQGPVVTIDEDFIRFRHETFQEYLCAEKLIRQPDRLEQAGKNDYSQWPMVLAYAAELQWPLPDPLWLFAWKINPWLGIALTDNKRANEITNDNFTGLRPEYQGKPLSFINKADSYGLSVFYHALVGSWTKMTDADLSAKLIWVQLLHVSKIVEYMILTNEEVKSRWTLFELCQICRSTDFSSFCSSYKYYIALKYDSLSNNRTVLELLRDCLKADSLPGELKAILKDRISQFIRESHENIAVETVLFALKNRIMKREDFAEKIPEWIQMANPKQAVELIDIRLAAKEDFAAKIPEWIRQATPEQATLLVDAGFAADNDFSSRIPEWIRQATPKAAMQLIGMGAAAKEDFAAKIPKWVQQVSPNQAQQLIRAGLASKEDFTARFQSMTPAIATQFIQAGVASWEDFDPIIPEWIRQATPKAAMQLIGMGAAAKEDFAAKIPKWVQQVPPFQARQLIHAGLASKEDFAARFQSMTPGRASRFIRAGVASREDFDSKIPEWIRQAAPEQARELIDTGFAVKEDFAEKIPEWIRQAAPEQATVLIDAGLSTKEDFAEKIPEWIRQATPKQVGILVREWSVSQDVFARQIAEWIRTANSEQTKVELIRAGFLPKYENAMLADETSRLKICRELAGIEWHMTAHNFSSLYSFFSHEAFPDNVFCPQFISKIVPEVGSIWAVRVTARPDKKKQTYGFFASSAELLSAPEKNPADGESGKNTGDPGLGSGESAEIFPAGEHAGPDLIREGQTGSELNEPEIIPKYQDTMLIDEHARRRICRELAGAEWQMTVCKSAPQYSFFQHKSFPGNVYCSLPVSKIVPEVGSKWKVRVTVRPDKKKQTYGFCAVSAEPLSAPAKNITGNDEQENSAVSSDPVTGEPNETLAAGEQINSDLRKEI